MPRLTRRQFLAAGTAALVGCGVSQQGQKPFSGRELRVFVYAGGHDATMRKVFVPAFEELSGAQVSLYPGWWDGVPKLKAAPPGQPPFDLMITDATQGFPAAREGLFAALNWANIPNHKRLVPAALDHWVFRDGLGLPYPDSVMTLAYNADKAGEAPTRWADLLRPGVAGQMGLYQSFYMSLYTFACILADQQGRAGTAHALIENDLAGVMRFARANREQVKLWWTTSADMILALANGECCAGNMHSPEYLTALREKPVLRAAVPEKDRAFVQVFWSVPADSPNQDLAEHALDFLFSDDMQLGFARRGMATAIPEVARKMAEEDALWKQLYPHTAEQFQALRYYPYDTYAAHWNELADEWDRTVLRKG